MSYIPKKAPPLGLQEALLSAFANYVEQELGAVARELGEAQTLELRTSFAEPVRPRVGMLAYADGTEWDPGSGEGLYVFKSGGWAFIV